MSESESQESPQSGCVSRDKENNDKAILGAKTVYVSYIYLEPTFPKCVALARSHQHKGSNASSARNPVVDEESMRPDTG